MIYKAPKADLSKFAKAAQLKHARDGGFAFVVGGKLVVIGGCVPGHIEVFTADTCKEETGYEAKSKSFYNQLACYTGETKMDGFSIS